METAVHQSLRREIGERIRQARKDKGLSQDAVAEVLGFTRQNISSIEQGHIEARIGHLLALSRMLNVSLLWLATGSEKPSE